MTSPASRRPARTGAALPVLHASPDPNGGNGPDAPSPLETALRDALDGDVRFDRYTRHLYATDASMYAIEPVGVVWPCHARDVQAVVRICAEHGAAVLPRGAGTSLAGQTVGRAVVLDFSRHMNGIVHIDPRTRTARVEPGVVQDDLNRAAAEHGLLFAPDTSTSNRATIGGMIGNNSCGARSARYGMTVDHVLGMDVVLADGSVTRFEAEGGEGDGGAADGGGRVSAGDGAVGDGGGRISAGDGGAADGGRRISPLEATIRDRLPRLVQQHADTIRAAMPAHWRRSGGYRLERLLPEAGPFNLASLVVGSEGTLAICTEATVRLVPKPGAIAALVGHFATIDDAIAAAPAAMDAGATTVELVDRMILDLARNSPIHAHLPRLLEGDPGAILWVECYGDGAAEATATMDAVRAAWDAGGHGYAVLVAPTAESQEGFRKLRKAGLGLLMSAGRGGERSIAFVEDTAVAPERLAEFTRRFAALLERHGLEAGFYGHASAGTLHIRPFMDVGRPGVPDTMRAVAEEVLRLVKEYGGMNSSEHGDGLARGEFNRAFFGDAYYELMREVKRTFDPDGVLNPGKKVDVGPMTEHLRAAELPPARPLATWFAYDDPDASTEHWTVLGVSPMRDAADRCQRIGACRKSAAAGGVMCPSYMATREEEHATRGRANALVAALSEPDPAAALAGDRLHEILDLCLECKACKVECPLHVDLATLKSETLAHRYERTGVPLRARLFGHVRTLNRIGSALAPLSNAPAGWGWARHAMERMVGIDARRPLPAFQRETLGRWWGRRRGSGKAGSRGRILFLADSFTSYTEPEIGRASIELLEMAGWEVDLVGDVCCGRSFISKGMLKEARTKHRALLERLGGGDRAGGSASGPGSNGDTADLPLIVGCEPSCLLTLADEVPALAGGKDGSAEEAEIAAGIAGRVRLVDDLLADAVEDGSLVLAPDGPVANRTILFHAHCHQKAGGAVAGSVRLLRAIPGADVRVLDAGCCGMAGSFGFEAEHYDLSMRIGRQRLFPAVERAGEDALIAATGVSCRQQIAEGTGRRAEHPAVLVRRGVR